MRGGVGAEGARRKAGSGPGQQGGQVSQGTPGLEPSAHSPWTPSPGRHAPQRTPDPTPLLTEGPRGPLLPQGASGSSGVTFVRTAPLTILSPGSPGSTPGAVTGPAPRNAQSSLTQVTHCPLPLEDPGHGGTPGGVPLRSLGSPRVRHPARQEGARRAPQAGDPAPVLTRAPAGKPRPGRTPTGLAPT